MVKTKKAGILTKLVVLALLVYLATTLLNLRSQIQSAQTERDTLTQQVADQNQLNAELNAAVKDSDDPDRIADAAREKLGLVEPGEKVFVFTN